MNWPFVSRARLDAAEQSAKRWKSDSTIARRERDAALAEMKKLSGDVVILRAQLIGEEEAHAETKATLGRCRDCPELKRGPA